MKKRNVFIFDHPLIDHKLSILRDKNTKPDLFRRLIKEITTLMSYEVLKDLPLEEVEIETPIKITKARSIPSMRIPTVNLVWRAGGGMLDPVLDQLPTARVGFMGMYREENIRRTKGSKRDKVVIKQYYSKLPVDVGQRDAILLDPMLASGKSGSRAITILKKAGVKNIKFMCIVACKEGIRRITTNHPDVQIFCAALDKELLPNNYISPGLGDAGDRLYGTK